jgi:hypothetical protein
MEELMSSAQLQRRSEVAAFLDREGSGDWSGGPNAEQVGTY